MMDKNKTSGQGSYALISWFCFGCGIVNNFIWYFKAWVYIRISGGRNPFYIIGGIFFLYPFFFQNVNRLVVGNCRINFTVVVANDIVAGDIDACAVSVFSPENDFSDALITVHNLKIFMAEIGVVAVQEKVVLAGNGKAPNAIAV